METVVLIGSDEGMVDSNWLRYRISMILIGLGDGLNLLYLRKG